MWGKGEALKVCWFFKGFLGSIPPKTMPIVFIIISPLGYFLLVILVTFSPLGCFILTLLPHAPAIVCGVGSCNSQNEI